MWLLSYNVVVHMGSLVESRGIKGAVLSSPCLPGAMIVIVHDANEIHFAERIETSDLDFCECLPASLLGKELYSQCLHYHAFTHI